MCTWNYWECDPKIIKYAMKKILKKQPDDVDKYIAKKINVYDMTTKVG